MDPGLQAGGPFCEASDVGFEVALNHQNQYIILFFGCQYPFRKLWKLFLRISSDTIVPFLHIFVRLREPPRLDP